MYTINQTSVLSVACQVIEQFHRTRRHIWSDIIPMTDSRLPPCNVISFCSYPSCSAYMLVYSISFSISNCLHLIMLVKVSKIHSFVARQNYTETICYLNLIQYIFSRAKMLSKLHISSFPNKPQRLIRVQHLTRKKYSPIKIHIT